MNKVFVVIIPTSLKPWYCRGLGSFPYQTIKMKDSELVTLSGIGWGDLILVKQIKPFPLFLPY